MDPKVLPNEFQSSLLLLQEFQESSTVEGKTRPSKFFINDFSSSVQLYISAVTLSQYYVLPFKKVPSGISTARPQFRDESEIQIGKSSSTNWIFSLFRTGFLLLFEIDFCRLKIRFVELEFSNLIFRNSSKYRSTVNVSRVSLKLLLTQPDIVENRRITMVPLFLSLIS